MWEFSYKKKETSTATKKKKKIKKKNKKKKKKKNAKISDKMQSYPKKHFKAVLSDVY